MFFSEQKLLHLFMIMLDRKGDTSDRQSIKMIWKNSTNSQAAVILKYNFKSKG